MTAPDDAHADKLRAYDHFSAEFADECIQACEAGASVAAADLNVLADLARAIVASARSWSRLTERLEFAPSRRMDAGVAIYIILETVFDDALQPSACRALGALVALTETGN